MRFRLGILAAVTAWMAGTGDRACGQDAATFKHTRNIFFPIPVERMLSANPRPTKVRLWAATPGQKWKMVSEKSPDNLETNGGDGSRGFFYTAPEDGEIEFASQRVFSDGTESPREASLRAEFRVTFDTRPPSVQAAAYGTTGIEWDVRDEHLDPDGVAIEARYKDTNRPWSRVKERLKAQDRYTWSNIPNGYTLEVRVAGKDKAGNESFSRIITLPTAGGGTGLSSPGSNPLSGRSSEPFARTGATSYGDDIPTRPEIQYFKELQFDVRSKITRVTKSGVGKVILWVRDEKTGWKESKEQPADIRFEQTDPWVSIPFTAAADGLYEFRVVPVSRAQMERGDKSEAPGKNDPAQIMVEVDTTKPEVQIRSVKVSGGVSGAPKVEIDFVAKDRNLIADNPVILEWARDPNAPTWEPIARTRRDGPYVWDAVPENEWKLFIRARAIDKAANEGRTAWDKPVIIDLDRPEATIEKIERPGGGGIQTNPGTERKPPASIDSGTPVRSGGGNLLDVPGLPGSNPRN